MEKFAKEFINTGGTCSGKSEAMKIIPKKLRRRGFYVYEIQEAATRFMTDGNFSLAELAVTDPIKHAAVEKQITLYYLGMRAYYQHVAKALGGKAIILFDRGPMDAKAYMDPHLFKKILKEEHLTMATMRDSFDLVTHLVTAADGAEKFYNFKNKKRTEDIASARILDKKTQNAWVGAPKLTIIDNSTDFKGKMNRLFKTICRSLDMPAPIETERRFLIKTMPDFKAHDISYQDARIEQVYLGDTGEGERIRQRTAHDNSSLHYKAVKDRFTAKSCREYEQHICHNDYLLLSKDQQSGTSTILKKRRYFVWQNQYFEFNIIRQPKKLLLLEVELTEENDKVVLPPFIVKAGATEVTGDKKYSNYQISKW